MNYGHFGGGRSYPGFRSPTKKGVERSTGHPTSRVGIRDLKTGTPRPGKTPVARRCTKISYSIPSPKTGLLFLLTLLPST